MTIKNSTPKDIDLIFALYDAAVAYQKTKFNKHWQPFDRDMVTAEIAEGRQWKIVEDGQVACVFAVAYNDPFIWGEKDREPSIYLHRIVTHPDFKGRNYVQEIIKWAHQHGKETGKQYIRLDTWGDNEELIAYYQQCGFRFLGVITPTQTDQLPKHYSAISLSLFEIKI